MLKVTTLSALLFVALANSPTFADQPDPAFLQKALSAVQAQRNQAADVQAALEARLAIVSDDLSQAKKRIKELEDKSPSPASPQK